MKINNRGEIATAIVILIAAGCLAVGTLAPKLNPINWITGNSTSSVPKEKSKYERKKFLSEPVLLSKGDHVAVGQRTEELYEKGEDQSERKTTFGERIGGFISSMTVTSIVFILISLIFFGGAPIVWVAKKYFKTKAALTATISGIKEVKKKDPNLYENIVKPELLKKHDKADSKVIDKIKSQIKA